MWLISIADHFEIFKAPYKNPTFLNDLVWKTLFLGDSISSKVPTLPCWSPLGKKIWKNIINHLPSTLHIDLIWFLCISPEKKSINSEFGQITNTNMWGTENRYQLTIFDRIPNCKFTRSLVLNLIWVPFIIHFWIKWKLKRGKK